MQRFRSLSRFRTPNMARPALALLLMGQSPAPEPDCSQMSGQRIRTDGGHETHNPVTAVARERIKVDFARQEVCHSFEKSDAVAAVSPERFCLDVSVSAPERIVQVVAIFQDRNHPVWVDRYSTAGDRQIVNEGKLACRIGSSRPAGPGGMDIAFPTPEPGGSNPVRSVALRAEPGLPAIRTM